ncbi:hypothetical protein Anas_07065 [Armadillidium nasatum]|uniref:C-type lectin domain-containing protein n=1 Tax=Armadillidium nasatum TaxID=96803 RepID=A0A5N5SHP3_9CRUS|nr:hypothetical protein Anas_07065 [Armadillidium nasatum]
MPTVLCANGLGSVKSSDLCDYEPDCEDASDELNFNLCKMLSSNCDGKNQVQCSEYDGYGDYDSYWSNRCTNIIIACNVGAACFSEPSKFCEEIQNGRLKAPKYRNETSKPVKPKEDEEFRKLMEFIGEAMNETMKRNFSECPPFFTPFGDEDKCISLFTPAQVSWFEARMFCESMTGSLAILDDIDLYIQVLNYIKEKEIKSQFWIGGKNDVADSGNLTELIKTWTWLNGEPVTMGVPYWSLFTLGASDPNRSCEESKRKLMPRYTGDTETCLSISEENFYYFSDEFCTSKRSPLCMANKT